MHRTQPRKNDRIMNAICMRGHCLGRFRLNFIIVLGKLRGVPSAFFSGVYSDIYDVLEFYCVRQALGDDVYITRILKGLVMTKNVRMVRRR